MKKIIFVVVVLVSFLFISGCFNQQEKTSTIQPVTVEDTSSENVDNEPKIKEIVEDDAQTKIALEAIRNALRDEKWVKDHVMMQKTCFGEDVSFEDQELTFAKLGKDRVIVQAFAYEKDFGISNTVISYQDGKVVTMGLPTVEEPSHPGHVGYGIVPDEGILAETYMHMGYYVHNYYKVLEDKFDLLASFEASEYDESGNLLEDESSTPLVDYKYMIHGEEETGRTTFEAFEQRVMRYMDAEKIESIEIPLTDENVDQYLGWS